MRSTVGSSTTKMLRDHPDKVEFGRFRVLVTSGPDEGAARVADSPELGIGTARANTLMLTDRAVSRHHCAITATPRGFLLRDLGSTNGTTLGGFVVESAYVTPGATIGVGETRLRFELLPDVISEPIEDGPPSVEDGPPSGPMLGRSTAMQRIFALLPRLAASDSTVLIEGETGTGKGLLAEMLHQQSPRAAGPFVIIDCGAIPPSLIEAELFGHAKGAFTGAQQARAGVFEAAAGGTVLLDEIGELGLDLQPKLLRAIEARTIRRLGSVEIVNLDVRILAATNRDLRQEVNRGSFRSDLFYRLNIVRIRVPALRERPEDIPLLLEHFHRQFTDGTDPPRALLETLLRHDFPGNVRELRGVVERAVLLGDPTLWLEAPPTDPAAKDDDEQVIREDDLSLSFRAAKEQAIARWERAYVKALIRAHDGNLSRAGRAAHMDRNHLRELLQRHRVRVPTIGG